MKMTNNSGGFIAVFDREGSSRTTNNSGSFIAVFDREASPTHQASESSPARHPSSSADMGRFQPRFRNGRMY